MTPDERVAQLEHYKERLSQSDPKELVEEMMRLGEAVAYYQGAFIMLKSVLDGTLSLEDLGLGTQAELKATTVEAFHDKLLPQVPPLKPVTLTVIQS